MRWHRYIIFIRSRDSPRDNSRNLGRYLLKSNELTFVSLISVRPHWPSAKKTTPASAIIYGGWYQRPIHIMYAQTPTTRSFSRVICRVILPSAAFVCLLIICENLITAHAFCFLRVNSINGASRASDRGPILSPAKSDRGANRWTNIWPFVYYYIIIIIIWYSIPFRPNAL